MTTPLLRRFLVLASAASLAVGGAAASACSGSSSDADGSSADSGGNTSDASSASDAPAVETSSDAPSSSPLAVSFSYRPSWKGVKSVAVIGAFGQSGDWTTPLVTLADDGTGTFTGKANLPAGHYTYLFQVVGDEAGPAAKADTLSRYAIDPSDPAFVACPMTAPTYNKQNPNPCSDLTVPQAAPAPTYHARGLVISNGAPVSGYLVEVERNEDKSHHMFANRTTTGADGTFDLVVSAGDYRFQVLHPTYYAMTDKQRTDPDSLGAVRRSISSTVTFSADRVIDAAEVSFTGYGAMGPRGATTLPTTFTFAVPAGAKARAAVYGPGPELGDPWWTAPFGTSTSDVFDGGFNTGKAPDGGLQPDASYAWGTEEQYPPQDGGVSWTAQSMVYPVQFP